MVQLLLVLYISTLVCLGLYVFWVALVAFNVFSCQHIGALRLVALSVLAASYHIQWNRVPTATTLA